MFFGAGKAHIFHLSASVRVVGRLEIVRVGEEAIGTLSHMIPFQPPGILWPLLIHSCIYAICGLESRPCAFLFCNWLGAVGSASPSPEDTHLKPVPFLTYTFGENQCYHGLP